MTITAIADHRPARRREPENLRTNNPRCPSCGIRWLVGAPTREAPAELFANPKLPSTLAIFAREFDEMADDVPDEHFTAVDFIDWLTPSIRTGGSQSDRRRNP